MAKVWWVLYGAMWGVLVMCLVIHIRTYLMMSKIVDIF